MLAIQKQQKYIQKAVQLPNGAWVMVVFELVERDGHIIAHAVSGKLLDDIEQGDPDVSYADTGDSMEILDGTLGRFPWYQDFLAQ